MFGFFRVNGSLVRSRASTVRGDRRGRRGAVGGVGKSETTNLAKRRSRFSVSSIHRTIINIRLINQSIPFQAAGELNRRAILLLISDGPFGR